jgi:hypothetical protein
MIKVGVVGVGRGRTFINSAKDTGMELVALCDIWEEKLNEIGKQYNVATYTDFDKFLEHDMDAVILANYFHRHAPFAIKALDAGLHVMSETTAVITMAEGVALINKVEETGKVYMLAENYPYFRSNQESALSNGAPFLTGTAHPAWADTAIALTFFLSIPWQQLNTVCTTASHHRFASCSTMYFPGFINGYPQ